MSVLKKFFEMYEIEIKPFPGEFDFWLETENYKFFLDLYLQ